jgi:hypothetical protein
MSKAFFAGKRSSFRNRPIFECWGYVPMLPPLFWLKSVLVDR